MLKCKNCEREYSDEFAFCPYCGEEKVILVNESDEERLNKVLPILKDTFEEVTSVGVESILLKLDEQRSLLINSIEQIESLGEKISEERKMNSETALEIIPEIPKTVEKPAKTVSKERKKDIVQAFSLIGLCIGVVAIALSLILPYATSHTGLNLLVEYFEKTFYGVINGANLKTLSTVEISYLVASWSLAVSLILYVLDSAFNIVRLINGKTQGRFYLIPTFAFIFAIISAVFANIADIASFGAYVLCISILFRIILGFFIPRTRE